MRLPEIALFLGVAALVIITPGQDTALTIRNTLLGGRSGGMFTAIGVSTGQATWTLVTALGLGALLTRWEPLYIALKLAGSVYLVYLGGRAILAGILGHEREAASIVSIDPGLTASGALRQGLYSNLGNPKMLAFFASLLPHFASSWPGVVALGLTFCTMTLIWLAAYSLAVARAGTFLRRPRIRRAMESLTGTVLVGLGLRLGAEPIQ